MDKTILTITLNPAVDKSSSVQNIIPEKNYVVILLNMNREEEELMYPEL